MSAPKFTPGPWHAHNIWTERVGGTYVYPLGKDENEAEANAQLCAAAPELYAELEAAHALLLDMRSALREARRTGNYAPALELLAREFDRQPKRERALGRARGEG